MLASTRQLDDTAPWVELTIGNALGTNTFVFVGIGDVAGHTKRRVEQLALAPSVERIRIIAPAIADTWVDSEWSRILPTLRDENKIDATEDDSWTSCCAILQDS